MVISRLDREGTPVPRHLVSPAQLLSSVISEAEEMSCVVKGSSAYLRENDAFIGGGGLCCQKTLSKFNKYRVYSELEQLEPQGGDPFLIPLPSI